MQKQRVPVFPTFEILLMQKKVFPNCCHQMRFPGLQCLKNAFKAGAVPRTAKKAHVHYPQILYAALEGPLHGREELRKWGWKK